MSDDKINRLIILAAALTFIGDGIALFAELVSQRKDEAESRQQAAKEKALLAEVTALRRDMGALTKSLHSRKYITRLQDKMPTIVENTRIFE